MALSDLWPMPALKHQPYHRMDHRMPGYSIIGEAGNPLRPLMVQPLATGD